jgi:hypothetical protein
MPASKEEKSNHDEFLSPVEERHIDYILEEEFSVNSDFLRFFLEQARLSARDKSRIVGCTEESDCIAVRSATTEKGETDLLVKYSANNGVLPTAILIEDKIRAGFQPDQATRYRERGDEGKGQEWSQYWTCLVAHPKYSAEEGDFDAVVSPRIFCKEDRCAQSLPRPRLETHHPKIRGDWNPEHRPRGDALSRHVLG